MSTPAAEDMKQHTDAIEPPEVIAAMQTARIARETVRADKTPDAMVAAKTLLANALAGNDRVVGEVEPWNNKESDEYYQTHTFKETSEWAMARYDWGVFAEEITRELSGALQCEDYGRRVDEMWATHAGYLDINGTNGTNREAALTPKLVEALARAIASDEHNRDLGSLCAEAGLERD